MFKSKYTQKLADYPPKARGFVVLGQSQSSHWTLQKLARLIEENDRRTLEQYPQGFIRDAIDAEFHPFVPVGKTQVFVWLHEGQVARANLNPCGVYLCWAEQYEDTPLNVRCEDMYYSIWDPFLPLAGEPDPRIAPREVRQARYRAYDMEAGVYSLFDNPDCPAMRKLLRVWKKAIPLDEDEDEEAAA